MALVPVLERVLFKGDGGEALMLKGKRFRSSSGRSKWTVCSMTGMGLLLAAASLFAVLEKTTRPTPKDEGRMQRTSPSGMEPERSARRRTASGSAAEGSTNAYAWRLELSQLTGGMKTSL
jgi:hypothetical protein